MANVAVLDRIADVAQMARSAPNGTLIGAYIRAARKFCRESRWHRVTLTGATEAGTRVYSLGSDPYLEVLGLRAATAARTSGDTKAWPLTVSGSDAFNPNAQPGRPLRYAYVPEAQIALDPLPDAIYNLSMTLVVQPKAGATQIDDSLLVKWDQVLQDGALAYLLNIEGQAWTNPTQAEIHRRAFQAGINNAKADEQREYNAGTVMIKRRPFLVGGM